MFLLQFITKRAYKNKWNQTYGTDPAAHLILDVNGYLKKEKTLWVCFSAQRGIPLATTRH